MIVYNYVDQNTNEVVATTVSRQFGWAWAAVVAFVLMVLAGIFAWAYMFTDVSAIFANLSKMPDPTPWKALVGFLSSLTPTGFYLDLEILFRVVKTVVLAIAAYKFLLCGYYGEHPIRSVSVLQENPKEDKCRKAAFTGQKYS